ncbi:alkaline phosphatase family protein [candidate division WOR-3 bacterium]|nr:alkaline phosphatase family protein [candidate division WOR-3 bacterium]
MNKVFLIGLDGAPYKEVKEWIEAGELPFLSKLSKEGAFGKLKSVIPPVTMVAWPVICTGKNSAKIGSFLYKSKDNSFNSEFFSGGQFINSTDIKTWSLWEWISHFGGNVGVLNIPLTYPPKKVNGFLVSGFPIPEKAEDYIYPPDLKKDLSGYRVHLDRALKSNKDRFHKVMIELLKERKDFALKLIKRNNPDFFMMNFKEMDEFMHVFWDRKDYVLDYFKQVDSYIQQIYKEVKPDNILIISDHGFTDAATKFFYINQYLEDNGYLKRSGNIKSNLMNILYKMGLKVVAKIPQIRKFVPKKAKSKVIYRSMGEKVDWDKTKAYANEFIGIFLNPQYYPNEEDKKKGAKEIKDILNKASDPDNGEKIFLVVKTKWELYQGPYFDDVPDVIYTTNKDYALDINIPGYLIDKNYRKIVQIEGQHFAALDGIIFVQGKNIKPNVLLDKSVEDIFPTVCALADLPIPEDVDGKVIKEALKNENYKESFESLPYSELESSYLSEEERKSVENQLKDLGYL